MPTEELEQALLAAKLGTAEEDVPAVIARLLDLPREAVVRVEFAFHAAQDMRLGSVYLGHDEIPDEVQTAMRAQLRRGLLRVLVRQAIINETPMFTHPRALIPKKHDICRGCGFSLNCVVKSYSTPDKCFKSGPPAQIREVDGRLPEVFRFSRGGAMVQPLRIRGDRVTVTSTHPAGTYDVDVGELWAGA